VIPRRAVPPALRALLLVLASALFAAPAQASLPTLADLSRAGDELQARPSLAAIDLPRELPGDLPKECNGPFCVEALKTRVGGFDLRLSCQVGGEAGVTCTARPAWGLAYGGRAAELSVFTGHVFDTETGLYNAKARYFDPKLGRFLTQDSFLGEIDAPPSLHRYLYANDNPTRFVDPTGHAAKDGQTSACPQGSTCISPAAEPSTGSLVRGGLAYGVETTAEFLSPMPLGLSDPDTSIHPLANNTASSSWLTGDNQISADYAAFKERYGRGAQVVEGAAVAKYGGKVGKVIGATMIVGAMLYGKPEVNGTQGEEGNFGPEKGDREPLPADKDPARQNAGGTQAQYRGGPHEETKLPTGDTLDSHHMPARSISPLDAEKGPAIKMEREEHRLTSSYGSGPGAVEYRAKIKEMIDKGEWRQALATEIRDVRRVAGAKYNQAIKEMLEYARTLKETGLLKKVAK
jgi:RHS repeat-associated protein